MQHCFIARGSHKTVTFHSYYLSTIERQHTIDHFAVETHWDTHSTKMTGKIQDDGTFNLIKGGGMLESS